MKPIGEKRVGFKLDDAMFEELQAETKRTLVPVAALLRKLVEEHLQRVRAERKKR